MKVSGVSSNCTDFLISGHLIDGSYMGPEAVLLCDKNGDWVHSVVTQHSIESLKNWPVVPGDGSVLILSISSPRAGFALDTAQLVVGQGAVTRNENRVDISSSLGDAAFWAIWMPLHLDCDALPEPSKAWGLSNDKAEIEYLARFQTYWDSGTWPYVRLGLPKSRYVEIEYAAGIEHQNRVWIGAKGGRRVLLGYDSGHFSFPTMRIQEVLDLAQRIEGDGAASLLLLAGAYLIEGQSFPSDAARRWLRQSPGFNEKYMDAILIELANNVVPELRWEFKEEFGWINNGRYSQRNPKSPLSILSTEDFDFVREFFRF
jgi:hypothetical protein